jgi:ERCC4-type nuclease
VTHETENSFGTKIYVDSVEPVSEWSTKLIRKNIDCSGHRLRHDSVNLVGKI